MIASAPVRTDIVSGTGDVLLGPGWHSATVLGDENFRWLTHDVTAYVPAIERIEHRVSIDLEATRAVDPLRPFALEVFDEHDRPVAHAAAGPRRTIRFILPAGPPVLHALRFHVRNDTDGPAGVDPGIPPFRIFGVRAEPLRPEVVPLLAGFRLGRGGWYGLEEAGGEVFRWVNDDAEILVTNAAADTLELDVAPGPGSRVLPVVLQVLDDLGEDVARFEIDSRRRVAFGLPRSRDVPYAIRLHVARPGEPVPGHQRILNLRVFHIPPA